MALDYWNDLPLQQMVERARTLEGDELVLYASLMQDAAGLEFNNRSPVSELSAASRRPLFGVIAEDLGQGIVGGVLISMELSGKHSAEVALRILRGERALSIPISEGADTLPIFDWRQLRRWGIRERDLPPGSVVRFEKVSVWDTYWKEISVGVGVIVLESLLVAGLIVQLRRRRETERELAAAEMRHRTVADFTHDWEFWQRPDGSFEYVSPACSGVSGYGTDDFKRSPSLLEEIVLGEDRLAWAAYQQSALEGRRLQPIEYRIKTREGAVRWVEQASNPVLLEGGRFAGTRGSIRDISERKESQLELQRAYEEIRALKDRLEAENTYYREEIRAAEGPSELIGHSDALKYVIYRIRQVAPSDTTVLIQGETGTGKELVADAIHQLSARADRPLVKVNCAALPQGLAESELFGHEKGAFTGAQSQRKGRFELADGATLFLDEVGELPAEVQAKLLRVLQDGQFERVGGTPHAQGGGEAHRRHQPRPQAGDRGGPLPGGSLVPPECFPHHRAHAHTSAATTSRPWRNPSWNGRASGSAGRPSRSPSRSCRPSRLTPGPATCESSRTSWSAPSSSQTVRPSAWPTSSWNPHSPGPPRLQNPSRRSWKWSAGTSPPSSGLWIGKLREKVGRRRSWA